MSNSEQLLKNADRYRDGFDKGGLPMPPAKKVAVLACMDARLNVYELLGLQEGDVHVIRNAGGVASDDAIRSLAISQNLLGTEEIILLHHTDCGMLTFTDDEFAAKLEAETGRQPEWRGLAFSDPETDVREAVQRIRSSAFIPKTQVVRGFVYDVESGGLQEVA